MTVHGAAIPICASTSDTDSLRESLSDSSHKARSIASLSAVIHTFSPLPSLNHCKKVLSATTKVIDVAVSHQRSWNLEPRLRDKLSSALRFDRMRSINLFVATDSISLRSAGIEPTQRNSGAAPPDAALARLVYSSNWVCSYPIACAGMPYGRVPTIGIGVFATSATRRRARRIKMVPRSNSDCLPADWKGERKRETAVCMLPLEFTPLSHVLSLFFARAFLSSGRYVMPSKSVASFGFPIIAIETERSPRVPENRPYSRNTLSRGDFDLSPRYQTLSSSLKRKSAASTCCVTC